MVRLAIALGAATVALGLAACAGTGGSTVATAQSPQCDNGMLCGDSVDKDKDGQVTASEWSATFQSMDTNGDGVVSQSEFQAAGAQWGGGGGHGR
jgi:EF hand